MRRFAISSVRHVETRQQRRFLSSAMAFDIDGVLLRGKELIPGARDSLKRLEEANVPFVFVTNGGGCTEQAKALELTQKFGIEVSKSRVVLSHSPMRELSQLSQPWKDKRVLVLGNNASQIAAEDVGLSNVVTAQELACENPGIFHFVGENFYVPRHFPPPPEGKPGVHEPVAAVMVLHDPLDWLLEIQITIDVLAGGQPPGTGMGKEPAEQIPMFISNPDFVFASHYPAPRFAAGAFTDCVKGLYYKRFGRNLKVGVYGKPTAATFAWAARLLDAEQRRRRPEAGPLKRIYMVGDNPPGDVKGANDAGPPWESMLVRTGVFSGGANDPENPAKYVQDSVVDCVDFVLEREAGLAADTGSGSE